MKRAVLLTGHFPEQKRKGAMLWVADGLQGMGWHVTIATVGYSWTSLVRPDPRLASLDQVPPRGLHRYSKTLDGLYLRTPVHPFNFGQPALDFWIGLAQTPGFTLPWMFALRKLCKNSDLIIAESGAPVLLARSLAFLAPQTPRIYRANDSLAALRAPAWMQRAEKTAIQYFTRISTGSRHLAAHLAPHFNITIDGMGVPLNQLATQTADPFGSRATQEVVCAGSTQIDFSQILYLAKSQPNWRIHIFGRLKQEAPAVPNVVCHGETPFAQVCNAICHADIGLAPYPDTHVHAYQADHSNRILLYRHYGLPVLTSRSLSRCASDLLDTHDPSTHKKAAAWGRRPKPLPDWSELAKSLSQNAEIAPVPEVISTPEIVR